MSGAVTEGDGVAPQFPTSEEFLQLWCAALESKEYQQGRGRLRAKVEGAPDEFCCLGVACDVLAKRGLVAWSGPEITDAWDTSYFCDGASSYLPNHVAEHYPWIHYAHLALRNDQGDSFAEIVQLIRTDFGHATLAP